MLKNALIVDDSRLACRMLAKMLDTFNIANSEVYSAEDALIYLQSKQPDVIFLDHTMQGMNGLEMMKRLKSNPLTASIPVMMYTAKEGDFYVKQAKMLGAAEVLPKGMNQLHLFRVLSKFGLIDEKIKNEISPQLPQEKKPVTIRKAAIQNNQPVWKLFWQQRVEPYLERHRNQQQKDLHYRIDTQTRQLTREVHLTLEQFEHALVLRMESHAEFVASVENEAKSMRRKWFVIVVAAIILLQVGIFFHLSRVSGLNNDLLLVQEDNLQKQAEANEQLLQLRKKLDEIKLNAQIKSEEKNEPDNHRASLINGNGLFVTEIILVDKSRLIYKGVTTRGYHFEINSNDEVGKLIKERYFLTDNCEGDIFVKSPVATIFRGYNNDIWYVDKQAELTSMNIGSKLKGNNECITLSGNVMSLRYLQRNIFIETGIDQQQTMKIYFDH